MIARSRPGALLAGIGGGLLAVALAGPDWFRIATVSGTAVDAFDSLTAVELTVLVAAALGGLALAVTILVPNPPPIARPLSFGALLLGLAAALGLMIRIAAPPTITTAETFAGEVWISRLAGVWLALAGALLMTFGGWLAARGAISIPRPARRPVAPAGRVRVEGEVGARPAPSPVVSPVRWTPPTPAPPLRGTSATAAPATSRASRSRQEPEAASPRLIDLNHAGFEDLRALALSITQARRILRVREQRGGFASLDELDEIPGLSASLRAELKRWLRV